MKYKLWFGLFSVSDSGILYTPGYKYSIKLPRRISFKVHSFLNMFSYVCIMGTKLLFKNNK